MLETRLETERWYGCYGARGDLFTQESNRHPAKMAVQLCYRIFEHGRARGYWTLGDTILDPMGGIGTTGIVGASLGYDVVLLELEHHFLSLAAANICVLRTRMPSAGKISLLPGDARQLQTVLARADAAITSPPYADRMSSDSPGGIDWTKQKDGRTKPRPNSQGNIPNSFSATGAVTSPVYGDQQIGGPIAS